VHEDEHDMGRVAVGAKAAKCIWLEVNDGQAEFDGAGYSGIRIAEACYKV